MVNVYSELTEEDLDYSCEICLHPETCGRCEILKEREMRLENREDAVSRREEECHIREVNFGQDRDVYHNGSIIKGGGVSKPEWMNEDEYSEYKMTAEYAHEISHVNDSEFDEPDYDDVGYDGE
jgi:hypothetical protein